MLRVQQVSKWFNEFQALKNVSFDAAPGEIVGFLGPNGAGKSTTLKIITTYLSPDSGDVEFNGYSVKKNPEQIREFIGYLPEQTPLYSDLKVIEQLEFAAGLRGLEGTNKKIAIEEVIELCSLGDVVKKVCGVLSKGYKQRVGLAQAMLGKPELLILDEPTSGLDPLQIMQIRELIKTLSESRTIVLSTHILQEVAASCNKVVIINHGVVVYSSRIDNLNIPLEELFVKIISKGFEENE